LAADASLATREGRVGAALILWKELLDRYPYEADDVARAEAARSTLMAEGRAAIKALEGELERASFFQLRMGFEECWNAAQGLKQRYAGSDLEPPLDIILESIRIAREQFPDEVEQDTEYRAALIQVLQTQGANGLASQVQTSESTQLNQEGN
jgi:hypothetical protein